MPIESDVICDLRIPPTAPPPTAPALQECEEAETDEESDSGSSTESAPRRTPSYSEPREPQRQRPPDAYQNAPSGRTTQQSTANPSAGGYGPPNSNQGFPAPPFAGKRNEGPFYANAPAASQQKPQSTRAPSARDFRRTQPPTQPSGRPSFQPSQQSFNPDFQQSPESARPRQQASPMGPLQTGNPASASAHSQYQAPNNPYSARTFTQPAQSASRATSPGPSNSTRNGRQAPRPSESQYTAPGDPYVSRERSQASVFTRTPPSVGTGSSATESVYPMGKPVSNSDLVSWLKIAHDRLEAHSRRVTLYNAMSRYGGALRSEGRRRDRYSNRYRFSETARQGLDMAEKQDDYCSEKLKELLDEDLYDGQFAYMMNRSMYNGRFTRGHVPLPGECASVAIGTLAAGTFAPGSDMDKLARRVIAGDPAPVDQLNHVVLSQWPRIRTILSDHEFKLDKERNAGGVVERPDYRVWEKIYEEDQASILKHFPSMAEFLDKHKGRFAGLNFDFKEAASLPEKRDFFDESHPIKRDPRSEYGRSRSSSGASSSGRGWTNGASNSSRSQDRGPKPSKSKGDRYRPER